MRLILIIATICTTIIAEASAMKITQASAVRLREKSTVRSNVVATITIGTKVTVLTRTREKHSVNKITDFWYKVRTPHNKVGWIFGSLLSDLNIKSPAKTYIGIAKKRLQNNKLVFDELAETVRFTRQVQNTITDREHYLTFTLLHLQLLKRSLLLLEKNNAPLQHAWYKENKQEIFYHELAGSWDISHNHVWSIVKKNTQYRASEELAWFAAHLSLGGECEGYVPCYVSRIIYRMGRYLQLYPSGTYADKALASIIRELQQINNLGTNGSAEKKELLETVAALERILKRSKSDKKLTALKLCEQLKHFPADQ